MSLEACHRSCNARALRLRWMEAQRAAEKEAGMDQAASDSQGAVGTVERLHLHVLAWKQLRSLVHIAMASVHNSALKSTWSAEHSAGKLQLAVCSYVNNLWAVLWRIFNGARGKGTRMNGCDTFSP